MLKIKMLDLSIGNAVVRYYLMMAGTIILGFLGHMTLAAIWALIFAVSAILGVSIKTDKKETIEKVEGEIFPIERKTDLQKAG